jgi:hypothetical protein
MRRRSTRADSNVMCRDLADRSDRMGLGTLSEDSGRERTGSQLACSDGSEGAIAEISRGEVGEAGDPVLPGSVPAGPRYSAAHYLGEDRRIICCWFPPGIISVASAWAFIKARCPRPVISHIYKISVFRMMYGKLRYDLIVDQIYANLVLEVLTANLGQVHVRQHIP